MHAIYKKKKTVSENIVQVWFEKFKIENLGCKSFSINEIHLKEATSENPCYKLQELSHRIYIPKNTKHDHLKKIGYTHSYNIWVALFPQFQHVILCWNEMKKHFSSKHLIIGDEKKMLNNNVSRKISQNKLNEDFKKIFRGSLYSKTLMICVRWNFKRIVFCEL